MVINAATAPRRRSRSRAAGAPVAQQPPLPLPPTGDPRQPLPIQLPKPPPPTQRGLSNPMIEGPQHLFHDPPPLPSVAERVRLIVADIDWNAPALTIWVPGTTEYWIKQRFLDELHEVAPGAHVTMVPYESTWRFSTSVPDGAAVLRGVLDEAAKRAPGRPVLLAGESQGAWIISSVLTDPKYAKQVTRTSIWGHPAAAPQQFGRAGAVREHNSPGDIVSFDLGPRSAEIMASIEQLSKRNFVGAVSKLAGHAVQQPDLLVRLVKFWSFALPVVGKGKRSDHDYDDDIAGGVQFLVEGLGAATRKRFTAYRDPRAA